MREIMTELEKSDPSAFDDEDNIPHIIVCQRHLLAGLERVTPSVSVSSVVYNCNQIYNEVDNDIAV